MAAAPIYLYFSVHNLKKQEEKRKFEFSVTLEMILRRAVDRKRHSLSLPVSAASSRSALSRLFPENVFFFASLTFGSLSSAVTVILLHTRFLRYIYIFFFFFFKLAGFLRGWPIFAGPPHPHFFIRSTLRV